MGIAMQSYTKHLFEPLPDTAVAFVCTCIEHAIREYESGDFTMIRFRGQGLNGMLSMICRAVTTGINSLFLLERRGDKISQSFQQSS